MTLFLRRALVSMILLAIAFLGIPSSDHSAWAARPGLRLTQGVRANLRDKGGDIQNEVLVRSEMELVSQKWWRFVPFAEARRDVDRDIWSRVELGAELGMQPFRGFMPPFSWFYVAHGLHQAWLNPGRDHPEWQIRTLFDVPLPFKIRSRSLSSYALNEYTVDLRINQGIRNEVAAGLKIPLPVSHFNLLLGWRHVDLIHAPDVDQFEGSLQFDL